MKIKVKPSSGEQKIEEKNGIYIVKLRSAPENNKANIELLKFLKKHFKKSFKIKSGFSSRDKIVEEI